MTAAKRLDKLTKQYIYLRHMSDGKMYIDIFLRRQTAQTECSWRFFRSTERANEEDGRTVAAVWLHYVSVP